MEDYSKKLRETIRREIIESFKGMRGKPGVHAETAITAAGGIAGTAMLLDCAPDFKKVPPGSPVLNEKVDEMGPQLLQALSMIAGKLGLDPATGWEDEIPKEFEPLEDVLVLVQKIKPKMWNHFSRLGFGMEEAALFAAITGLEIIAEAKKVLDPNIGKALLMAAIVKASKSVPLRSLSN